MIVRKMVDFPKSTSFFLFGPRQTGKTTAVLHFLKNKKFWHINLLLSIHFSRYSKNPGLFREDIIFQIKKKKIRCIFIDEVQKLPLLLDEVHQLMEEFKSFNIQFILSGSSARKLKRGSANMLGGRAILRYMFPLTYRELQEDFNLARVLSLGSLPGVYFDDDEIIKEKLTSYVETYLKEEVLQEALVRNIGEFHRFLEVAAQHSSELISYENISRESSVGAKTVKSYFQILEDTLIGFILPVWDESIRKQLSSHPKFYFFDNGVLNNLMGGMEGQPLPAIRGKLFEQWIINEVRAYITYKHLPIKMNFWRTKAGNEIDLILSKKGQIIASIEIKAVKKIAERMLSGLKSLNEEYKAIPHQIIVCEELFPRLSGPIEILPWKEFLDFKLEEICT